jgi:hypothetical protein
MHGLGLAAVRATSSPTIRKSEEEPSPKEPWLALEYEWTPKNNAKKLRRLVEPSEIYALQEAAARR